MIHWVFGETSIQNEMINLGFNSEDKTSPEEDRRGPNFLPHLPSTEPKRSSHGDVPMKEGLGSWLFIELLGDRFQMSSLSQIA